MKNYFDIWNDWVNNTEGSLVNFLTAFAPWLAPLAPAYMTFVHMVEFLEFPPQLAVALAVLVEILGFGAVSTFLDFWFYNRRERSDKKKAPLVLVAISFGFYLGLILISNVVIDIAKNFGNETQLAWAIISVRALLTLQMIPGALIVAVRTGHRDLLREIKIEKEGKVSESSRKGSENEENQERNLPKDWRTLEPTLTYQETIFLSKLNPAQVKQLSVKHNVDIKTITNWRTRAIEKLKNMIEEAHD